LAGADFVIATGAHLAQEYSMLVVRRLAGANFVSATSTCRSPRAPAW